MPALVERNQVGKREDLADVIANVDSQETPVFSLLPKGKKPANTLFEWQVDDFRKGNRDGVPDGQDVQSFNNQSENRQRLQGRVQVFRESYGTGFIAEELSDVAGVKSEASQSATKALFVVRRTIEQQICSDDDSRPDGGALGAKTRGFGAWINPTQQTDLPVVKSYLTPDAQVYSGALSALAETGVQAIGNAIWKQTKQRKRLPFVCGIELKNWFSNLTQIQTNVSATAASVRQFTKDAAAKAVMLTVDMWSGDGIELELIPSAFLRDGSAATVCDRSGFIIDPDFAELRPFQLPMVKPLPDQGGGPRGFVQAMAALAVTNPKAHGAVKGT